MRYLGVCLTHSRTLKCSLDHAKRSFYRACNAVFSKVGRVASEEVTLHSITLKCIPVLLYCLESCPLLKSHVASLDLVVNRFFVKLFNTSDIEIVKTCQSYFAFDLPSFQILKRTKRLESKFLDTVLTTQSSDAVWDLCCLRVIVSEIYC